MCYLLITEMCYLLVTDYIYDRFPVSPGHTLIIPNKHVANFFELTQEEMKYPSQ
ncbi:HIT family protein [Microscilla marina]|uniref:HIT family protein n=1 Tax=Microscilla marina TaxID=1027 RepID=UPI0009E3CAB3|nr:HIT domain-containing protein [Microscilla marina]